MGLIDFAKNEKNKAIRRWMGPYIVFHHVPKCGGTSVARALRLKYLLSQTTIKVESSYRAFSDFTGRDDVDQLMIDVLDLREQMLLYWLHEDIRCISAHVRFSQVAYENFHNKYKFITVLRDPVERFISHYYWISGRPHEHPYMSEDFESFLETPRARQMGAKYVEYYCGLPKTCDLTSDEAIGAAMANLGRFDIIGRLDRLSDFEHKVKEILGINLKVGHENKMADQQAVKRNSLSPELRKRAEDICAPDLAIWQFAKKNIFK